jgi:hypothetical protein
MNQTLSENRAGSVRDYRVQPTTCGVTNASRDRDECKEVIGGSSIVSNTDQRNSSPSRIVEAGDRLLVQPMRFADSTDDGVGAVSACRERIIGVPTTNISERDGHGRSARVYRGWNDGRPRPSRAACLSQVMLLAIAAYLCSGLALWAQASDSQTGDPILSLLMASACPESIRSSRNSTKANSSRSGASSAALSVFGHTMIPLSSQMITDQCSNHGRLRAGWARVRAWSMVSKSPTRMSLCFVRHCPKLLAMTRNLPRGAFLSMSFVTLLPPALCYFHQLQNPQSALGIGTKITTRSDRMRW